MKGIKDFLKSILPIVLVFIIVFPLLYFLESLVHPFGRFIALVCVFGVAYSSANYCNSWIYSHFSIYVIIFSYLVSHFLIWLLKKKKKEKKHIN